MSGVRAGTRIGEAHGPTHTGSGDQHIWYLGPDGKIRGSADPLRVAAERRAWLRQRFVEPPGYGEVAERLEKPGGAVVLSGVPGAGRRSAAVMLLHQLGTGDTPIREVALDEKAEDQPEELADGERVLIDLTNSADQEIVDAQPLVRSYWTKVERVGGRLAVALAEGREHLLGQDCQQLVMRIGRPDGAVVLLRHLRPAGVEVALSRLRGSVLAEFFDRSPLRDLHRLSELVAEAAALGGTFDGWAEAAGRALRGWSAEVGRAVAGTTDGRQRLLLLTAAMLDGAQVDVVSRHWNRLLAKVEHPEDPAPRLDRADLSRRLGQLPLTVDGDGRIRFQGLAYAAAVRTHFWLYYPDLRPVFGEWVGEAVERPPGLEQSDSRNLVSRFADQALRVGDVDAMARLVESWATERRLLPTAMAVLERGLRDERAGAEFRAKIYAWATGPRAAAVLVQGLARMCLDVLAQDHPDQALVRLHHLARRETSDDARQCLFDLVLGDRRLYGRLIDRLDEGLVRSRFRQRDAEILVELMSRPSCPAARQDLIRGWHRVLGVAPPQAWGPGVKAWLSAASSTPEVGARLTGILVAAASGRPGPLSRYYLLAHEWAGEPGLQPSPVSRGEVAARFCREIDEAQGIGTTDPAPAGTSEGRVQ
ncbi:hypothetical protein ACIRBX_23790 [Kitasatospora sp. NPDC096147]|uniref:hypothetical protein n=1 Tax=Kitasatospora sp. NPDC096147 TaxID=3364093 RepID=UPI003806CF43